jgi:hypothetical protein
MANSYVPGLTPTFQTPAARSYVPGLTPSLQTPAANDFGLSPEALQALQAEMAAYDPSKLNTAPLNLEYDRGPAYDPNMVFRFDNGHKIGVPNEQGGTTYRNAHPIVYQPGQVFTMLDKKGAVIGTASNAAEMQALADKSSTVPFYSIEQQGGPSATSLGGSLPTKTDYGSLGSLLVNMGALALPAVGGSVLGPILSGALSSSAAVGAGLGTAIGSAASGITAGKSVGDILKQAALAGVTAGGLHALSGAPTGLDSITPSSAADAALASLGDVAIGAGLPSSAISGIGAGLGGGGGGVAASIASGVAPGFTVLAPSFAAQLANFAPGLGPSIADLVGGSTPSSRTEIPETVGPQTVVTANVPPTAPSVTPSVPSVPLNVFNGIPETVGPQTVVEGNVPREVPREPTPSVPLNVFNGIPETVGPQTVVEGNVPREVPREPTPIPVTAISELPPLNPPTYEPVEVPKLETEVDSGLSTMDKIRLGLLGAGLISDLAGGGGGGGSGGTIPGGLGGGRSPIFTAKLPPPNMPVSTPRTPSDVGNIDYYRYGYGPEQSFYTNVPKGEPNTSRAYTGYEERETLAEGGQPTPRGVTPMVEGNIDLHNRPVVRNEDGTISTVKSRSFGFDFGEVLLPLVSEDGRVMSDEEAVDQFRRTGQHLGVFTTPQEATEYAERLHEDQEQEYAPRSNFAVGGPGGGRDDKIPAMLSDGEYVIDAETVALLGNGSNKAGAKSLDQFRVNVRKHKGGKLAKGAFSVNAKRPEQYLKGRK